jgi:hypothetical protein
MAWLFSNIFGNFWSGSGNEMKRLQKKKKKKKKSLAVNKQTFSDSAI